MNRRWILRGLLPLFTGLLILGCWRVAGMFLVHDQVSKGGLSAEEAETLRPLFLPYPGEVLDALASERKVIGAAALNTVFAATMGFWGALLSGFVVSLALASSRMVRWACYPWILALQMTPIIILAPILVLWTGEGILATAWVTLLICFFPVVANGVMGLQSVDRGLVDLFRISRASRAQELFQLRIPSAMPYFLTGFRISGTLAPIGAMIGDLFVGTAADGKGGIGYLTILYKGQLRTPELFATAMVACLLGFGFVACVKWIHQIALRDWHDSIVTPEN